MMAEDFPGHFLFHDSYVVVRGWHNGAPKNLFIIFVDVVFTNLLEPLFTNAFDGRSQTSAHPCVWRACIAD
jgi:hypothetical protein